MRCVQALRPRSVSLSLSLCARVCVYLHVLGWAGVCASLRVCWFVCVCVCVCARLILRTRGSSSFLVFETEFHHAFHVVCTRHCPVNLQRLSWLLSCGWGVVAQARELYQSGCTYVVQQEALAAVVVGNMVSGCPRGCLMRDLIVLVMYLRIIQCVIAQLARLWDDAASKGLGDSGNDARRATSRFHSLTYPIPQDPPQGCCTQSPPRAVGAAFYTLPFILSYPKYSMTSYSLTGLPSHPTGLQPFIF